MIAMIFMFAATSLATCFFAYEAWFHRSRADLWKRAFHDQREAHMGFLREQHGMVSNRRYAVTYYNQNQIKRVWN